MRLIDYYIYLSKYPEYFIKYGICNKIFTLDSILAIVYYVKTYVQVNIHNKDIYRRLDFIYRYKKFYE